MRKNILLFGITLIFLASCKKDDLNLNSESGINGYWINPVYTDSTITFTRSYNLNPVGYGICFKPDYSFIERKNSGFCGTPPITYADYSGKWGIKDSILNINVPFWGGTADYQWKVLSLTGNRLRIYKIKEEFHY